MQRLKQQIGFLPGRAVDQNIVPALILLILLGMGQVQYRAVQAAVNVNPGCLFSFSVGVETVREIAGHGIPHLLGHFDPLRPAAPIPFLLVRAALLFNGNRFRFDLRSLPVSA